MVAGCGVGAIGTDEEVEVDSYLRSSVLLFFGNVGLGGVLGMIRFWSLASPLKPGCIVIEIGACKFVIEVEIDVWHFI